MTVYRDHDEDDDREADGDESEADSDEEPTVPCPYCRQEILEDSPRCPWCERYISAEDASGHDRPLWVTATALVCLAAALWWIFAAA